MDSINLINTMIPWNLRRIEYFIAVAHAASLSQAARDLKVTQPTLTTSIRKFEAELGFKLFNRDHGFELTALGKEFLPRAEQALDQIQHLQQETDLIKAGLLGELHIACGPTIADGIMGQAIARVINTHPDLKISVHVARFSELPPLLRMRKIDFFVAAYPAVSGDEDLRIEPLPARDILLFCRAKHPLTQKKNLKPQEIFSYPLIGPELPPDAITWLQSNQPDTHSAQPPRLQLESSHHGLLKTVVMESNSISGAPREVIQQELLAGTLVEIPLNTPPMQTQASIVSLRGRNLSPAARLLISEIHQVLT